MSQDSKEEIKESFDVDIKKMEKETSDKIRKFDSLLKDLSSAHDKKKSLWKEIYENAVLDRRNAYIMYSDLFQKVHDSSSEHAIHGATLAKYMERLTKSNDQLIKLAEIIEEAVEMDEDETLDNGNLYDRLEGEGSKKSSNNESDDESDDEDESDD